MPSPKNPGEPIECVLCGKRLIQAGAHFVLVHGMTADEYRTLTGAESSPRPLTCPQGHPLTDAPTRPDGSRDCLECNHEQEERADRDLSAPMRVYNQRPDVVARRKAKQASPEFKALAAKRQRDRRARIKAETT